MIRWVLGYLLEIVWELFELSCGTGGQLNIFEIPL